MSSSQSNIYKVVLLDDNMLASLYGFRRMDEEGNRYQVRILNSQKERERYEAEMWLNGMNIKLERIEQ